MTNFHEILQRPRAMAGRDSTGGVATADCKMPAHHTLEPSWNAHDAPSLEQESSRKGYGTVEAQATPDSPWVQLSASEVPAYCPNPAMPLWEWHPRVFLDVVNEIEPMCPYCGTRYRLKRGTRVPGHSSEAGDFQQRREPQPLQSRAGPSMPILGLRDFRETPNLTTDLLGNTTLELMTQWLRRRR